LRRSRRLAWIEAIIGRSGCRGYVPLEALRGCDPHVKVAGYLE
jgi:hypothetical protein